MDLTKKEYSKMVVSKSKKSPILKDCIFAFLFGGGICSIGQGILDLYISLGLEQKDARALGSVTLIFLGSFLTAIKIYDNIAKYAGAGTLVPITGFANSIVSPAIEFKSEGHILGLGSKMFVISGPVIVFGINASILYGFIIWIFELFRG